MLTLLKRAVHDFNNDECSVRAAALAYYTVFALPPLLILLLLVAGAVWNPQDVQRAMESQFASLIGGDGARAVHDMLRSGKRPGAGGLVATILGTAGLLFGAIGAFMQLQGALNRVWDVKPDPARGGIKAFIGKRVLSLGMLLGVAFLMIVSLAVSALVSALGKSFTFIPEGLLSATDAALSLGVITVLFAALFKVLPDVRIAWRDVWAGAIVTSVLFVAGKFLIGFYLGRSRPGSAFGAASALAVILVWIYYAGMIVLFGAEFTQAWAQRGGRKITPGKDAVRIGSGPSSASRREPSSESKDEPAAAARVAAPNEDTAPQHRPRRRITMDRMDKETERVTVRSGDGHGGARVAAELSIGELFRRMTDDSSYLVRQEINLAKTELRETGTRLVKTATSVAVAFAIAIPGTLAIAAFLVIALGAAMKNYWASALIVGVVLLGIAALLAQRGIAAVKKGIGIPETAETLRQDAQWAKKEVRIVKRELSA